MSLVRMKKRYGKGDVLLSEKPFVWILQDNNLGERCDYCFQKGSLKKCSGCSFLYYCGRNCQRKGWSYHQYECSNIARIKPLVPSNIVRYLGRIIIKLNKGGYEEMSYYTEKKFRTFKTLMSHYDAIKKDLPKMQNFINIYDELHKFLTGVTLPNKTELLEIFGKVAVNSFGILDNFMQQIGTGLYLGASVIDHSCIPNAVALFDGTKILIKTLIDMDMLDWDKVRVSYVETFDLAKDRQKKLKKVYYFDCDCAKCLDTEEIAKMMSTYCQSNSCRKIIKGGALEKTLKCPHCGEIISDETRIEINEVIELTRQKIIEMESTAYIDICRFVLNKQDHLFPPINIYKVKILFLAFDACITLRNWKESLEYGEKILEAARLYWTELHPDRADFFGKLAKVARWCDEDSKAKKYQQEAISIYSIIFGPNHPYAKEFLPS